VSIGFESQDGDYRLSVADDGVGTAVAVDSAKPGSLGLKVVDALVKQIGGAMSVVNDGGMRFDITFSDAADRASPTPPEPAPPAAIPRSAEDHEHVKSKAMNGGGSNRSQTESPRDEMPALAGASGSSQP
jgi:hypothetical protein